MRCRREPWKWPASIGLALLLVLAGAFGIPTSWVDAFFSPRHDDLPAETGPRRPCLVLMPPPEILIEEDSPPPEEPPERPHPRPAPPADWWNRGVAIAIVADTLRNPLAVMPDSVRLVLEGWTLDTAALLSVPDSLVQRQLTLWSLEEGYFPEGWQARWKALGRQWHMADLKSREADIFDEHLQSQIMVPRQGGR